MEISKEDLEQWKTIDGYNGYFVSSMGRVMGPRRLLKKCLNTHGYEIISLNRGDKKKTVTVHKLVMTAFCEKPSSVHEINHKNGIKTDNRLVNLEWITRADNAKHAFDTLLRIGPNRKLTESDIKSIRLLGGKMKQTDIARKYNVDHTTIYRIINKESYGRV